MIIRWFTLVRIKLQHLPGLLAIQVSMRLDTDIQIVLALIFECHRIEDTDQIIVLSGKDRDVLRPYSDITHASYLRV